MEAGVQAIIETMSLNAVIVRQGSAFCVYFMDHAPQDWHDLASAMISNWIPHSAGRSSIAASTRFRRRPNNILFQRHIRKPMSRLHCARLKSR